MKNIKKLLAVVVAMTMALMLAVPVFADETAPATNVITINGTTTGHTYEAYQVFAGDLSNDESGAAVLSNITWGNGVNGDGIVADLVATPIENLEVNKGATAADVAAALEGATAEVAKAFAQVVGANLSTAADCMTPSVEGTAVGEVFPYTINVPAVGYYFIKDETGSMTVEGENKDDSYTSFILQVVGPVTVTPKSGKPTVEKKVAENNNTVTNAPALGEVGETGMMYNDVADYDIGDTIPFQLTSLIPAGTTTEYEKYHITFNDTMSEGLTLDETSIKVYATYTDPESKQVTKADLSTLVPAAYKVTTSTTDGITVDVQICGTETLNGTALTGIFGDGQCKSHEIKVYVEYNASLNDKAVIGRPGNPNEVYLTYSNNPNVGGEGDTGKTPSDKVIVFTYELDTTKIDGDSKDEAGSNLKLKDAKFVLYKTVNGATSYAKIEANKLSWVADKESATTLTSDANGLFKVVGLDEGTYFLEETVAPTGYNLLTAPIELVITAETTNTQDGNYENAESATAAGEAALTALTISVDNGAATSGDLSNGTVSTIVENHKGATLPSTGGMGTTLFTIVGIGLMLGAAVLLIAKRRVEK